METIEYHRNEYLITDRVNDLISLPDDYGDIMKYAKIIFESKNYQEGKISEPILLAALLDCKIHKNCKKWLELLISDIFATGLISYDVATKISNLKIDINWFIIDEKYKKGIIKDEQLKSLFEMIANEQEEYCQEIEPVINSMLTILTSDEYKNGNVTSETIKLLQLTSEESSYEKHELIKDLFNKAYIKANLITDETLKLLLETKNPVITRILYFIIESETIQPEEKYDYIFAMLNLNNQENLSNIYNSYIEKKKTTSINEFAKNFVLYTLPLYEFGLEVSYTKKREKK